MGKLRSPCCRPGQIAQFQPPPVSASSWKTFPVSPLKSNKKACVVRYRHNQPPRPPSRPPASAKTPPPGPSPFSSPGTFRLLGSHASSLRQRVLSLCPRPRPSCRVPHLHAPGPQAGGADSPSVGRRGAPTGGERSQVQASAGRGFHRPSSAEAYNMVPGRNLENG